MTRRTDMLASEVRDIVAPILRMCPQECGMVSISQVLVAPDASYATLYITSLNEPQMALDFLRLKLPELQRDMSKLTRRKIPLLRVRLESGTDQADRVERLLKELE